MNKIEIKIINRSNNTLPQYKTDGSAGMDIPASVGEKLTIQPGKRALIPTGLYIELPSGYEGQIRSRSGLAFKHGICVLNSPGTIDADYRGELKVLLYNTGQEGFEIENGDRIAQLIIAQVSTAKWVEVQEISNSQRGEGGYGHTGKK